MDGYQYFGQDIFCGIPMRCRILLLLLLALANFSTVLAQRSGVANSLSQIQVETLTDGQLRQLSTQLKATNLSRRELTQYLMVRGMSREDAAKLLSRIQTFDRQTASQQNQRKRQDDFSELEVNQTDSLLTKTKTKSLVDSTVFGSELFRENATAFGLDLQLPTPKNYVLGPGDELNITVFGLQELDEQSSIGREGKINLPYAGMLQLSGLTIEQATARLRNQLAKAGYSSLQNGGSKLVVSLENPRSISVNVVGATKSGSYRMPAVASLMHALFMAGGPAEMGSFRQIQLIREGKVLHTLDLYALLGQGTLTENPVLQEQDVVFIPPHQGRISIQGEVKRPGIFEWKADESLQTLLEYAGGFTDLAVKDRILVSGLQQNRYITVDVLAENFATYVPEPGYQLRAMKQQPKAVNQLVVSGAVWLPGVYAWYPGLQLSELYQKFGGFRDDAVMNRALIVRKRPDQSLAYLRFNPEKLAKQQEDLVLEDGDSLVIASKKDFVLPHMVEIKGEVMEPAVFDFGEGMTVGDLIFLAGGLRPTASIKRIEVARKVEDRFKTAAIFESSSNEELSLETATLPLQAGDLVIVRPDPLVREHKVVELTGEFSNPGPYALLSRDERLIELIQRAGGLTPEADINSGILIRRSLATVEKKPSWLLAKEKKEQLQTQGNYNNPVKEQEDEMATNNPVYELVEEVVSDTITLNLRGLMNGNDRYNLWIKQGDILYVSPKNNTISVKGAVNSPLTINFYGRRAKSYVKDAGGFSSNADRKRVYVIEPNGQSRATTNFLWFSRYPKVVPGSRIVVPEKNLEVNRVRDPARTAAISSIAASTASVLITVIAIMR